MVKDMKGKPYGMDRILRGLMVIVGLVLMLAWFYKALAVKDGLAGLVGDEKRTEQAFPESRISQIGTGKTWERGRKWLAGQMADWLTGVSPAGKRLKALSSFEESGTGEEARAVLEEGAGEETWEETGKLRALAEKIGDWIIDISPLLSFLNQVQSPRPGYWDPDPSYSDYLERQRLMEESGYFLMYGDENSQAERQDMPEQGDYDEDIPLRELTRLTPAYHVLSGRKVTGTAYMVEQLMDYDFLMSHFYSVHSSTTAGRDEINAEELLARDLSIEKGGDGPQILIYHTHSQEEFADYGPDNKEATVIGIGNYLTELLTKKGYRVIHDVSQYDMMAGELDRNHAYNYALDGITGILKQNPSISVVLDIHRDGVSENLHMVASADGKQMAPIMFFNGMSQTPEGPIEYLENPYREENLAFSLQMQLDAAAYYPGLTRKIYLKGLRYNLHVRPRSALIEVGAQTNTYEEARNSMEPLAELLDMVLSG